VDLAGSSRVPASQFCRHRRGGKILVASPHAAAIFGWTQLVRGADNVTGGFEMDLIAIYPNFATPFASHGIRLELFDAPSRDPRPDMDWEAHTFLCISPARSRRPSERVRVR
jgi:hypothetical protein